MGPLRLRHGVFHASLLARQKWLRHAFGTRRVSPALGQPGSAARLRQVHSDIVRVIDRPGGARPTERLPGDALVTAIPCLVLTVATADCLPVLLADPEHRVVAAVHAGWRGTLKRIVEKTVGAMRRQFGTDPARIVAAFGPSIQACCYEVGREVIEEYRSQFPYASELFRKVEAENPADTMLPRQIMLEHTSFMRNLETGRGHLDLEEANRRQLLDAGVSPRRIESGAPCTACRTDLLFSYRKEGPGTGRLLAAIALLAPVSRAQRNAAASYLVHGGTPPRPVRSA